MRKQKIAIMAGILICGLTWSFVGWANDSLFRSYQIKKGDTLQKLFGANWLIVARINKITPELIRPGMDLHIPHNWEAAKNYTPLSNQIPNREEKLILVDLQKQVLGAYEFGKLKFWCPISSGRKKCQEPENCETPTGKFYIGGKDKDHISNKYPKPKGGAPMKYGLNLSKPDGTWTAYWIHAGVLLGWPSSNGCIRLFEEEAKRLFLWAKIKTSIEII